MAGETSAWGLVVLPITTRIRSKCRTACEKDGPACSSIQYSERKWQSDWHSMTKRVIGFSRACGFCPVVALTMSVSFDCVHKIGGRRRWLRPASQLLSKSKNHLQRHRRPCWHLDERVAERFRGFPIYSRRDLAALGFDNSQTNRLPFMAIFYWT